MVRFRTRLVAVTCAVAMVGSFWGSAGAIVSADAKRAVCGNGVEHHYRQTGI